MGLFECVSTDRVARAGVEGRRGSRRIRGAQRGGSGGDRASISTKERTSRAVLVLLPERWTDVEDAEDDGEENVSIELSD